jgi:hypothetical protein
MKQALVFSSLLAIALAACRVPSPNVTNVADSQHADSKANQMSSRQIALNKLTAEDKKALGLNED